MSDYTLISIEDVPDLAPQFGFAGGEARFTRDALHCRQVAFSHQRLKPGARSPFAHSHAEQEEVYVVLSGSGRVKLDDEIRELKTQDAIRIAGPTVRQFEAGPDGLEVIVMSTHGILGGAKVDDFWTD